MVTKKKPNLSTLKETLAAQAFLRAIGADSHDNYLILAVVAWLRQQEKANAAQAKFNNAFLINGKITYYPYGGHSIAYPHYKTLEEEMRALAKSLLASKDPSIRLIITASRYKEKKAGETATQFLTALQASGLDRGATVPVPGKPGFVEDAVWAMYATFTGVTLPTVKAPVQPKQRAWPTMPAALNAPAAEDPFPSPYAPRLFYQARHPKA